MSGETHSTIYDPRVEHLYMRAHALARTGRYPSAALMRTSGHLPSAADSPSLHAGLAAVLEQSGDLNGRPARICQERRKLHPKNPHYCTGAGEPALYAWVRHRPGRSSGALTVPLDGKMPPALVPIPPPLVAVARAVRSTEVLPSKILAG